MPFLKHPRRYDSHTKRRVIPLLDRVQPLLEGHFALYMKNWAWGLRIKISEKTKLTI